MAVSLMKRAYSNFRGVDFGSRKDEVNLNRSPDALNMWKNYKNSSGRCIETRPDIELKHKYTNSVFGHFFYTFNNIKHEIVHLDNMLYDNENKIYNNMAKHKSQYFIYKDKLYIKDATNYLVYDGKECKAVEGYIPITTTGKTPQGEGTKLQDVNLLTGIRKNEFTADGTSTEYQLDTEYFDTDYQVRVWIDNVETKNFTVNASKGKVIFTTAPAKPDTDGASNVVIQFRKTVERNRLQIEKCTLHMIFDNRVFFAGNPDYPNRLWHSSLENPEYCSDLDYYDQGFNDSAIKAIITGNNALWTIKEPSQTNTTIFYLNPVTDDEFGKVYPSQHSSINVGCIATGINFFDDIVFLSDRGLESITQDVTSQQVITHRSSLIDNRLLNEKSYQNAILEKWEGYLLIILGKHVYLADSRQRMAYNDHTEYEWFYWEFDEEIKGTTVDNNTLYILTEHEIYTLTNTKPKKLKSYWTTPEDEFNLPQMQKTTNKKGFVADVEGEEILVSVKTDNNEFEDVKELENEKGYITTKIKKKKWKSIQIKFSSEKPFGVFSCTLEAYTGAYIKR